ncbi:MAG: class I SAM-dependent methyltransferase, partial [Arenicellales bacterium]
TKFNDLTQLESGVWVKTDADDRSFIDYTDGSSTEEKVYAQVAGAQDRSVYSEELDQSWADWALEYHLGSKRSNIYRGLNLSGVKTVLEVGCGCGAITRFLGEQGFEVDAIEGTMRRAEIARLRTADLENVQIISSNYHELVLPEKSYDLVVFTGVLEYSGAYAAEGVSPEAQLKITLRHAQKALSASGQVLISIENRLGFKYLAGAGEDHLNVPNIGLLGYPEPLSKSITRGIRTWSKGEWQVILDDMGFKAHEFAYPFPDYKIPDAILSDHFLANNQHPTQVLGGIASRDYVSLWWPNMSEALFWDTAAQTGNVDQYANSFLIVVGQDSARIAEIIDFDFVRFASHKRKLPYRLQVSKKRDESQVRRTALLDTQKPEKELFTHHHIKTEPFVDGRVLEQIWLDALSITPSYDELAKHLQVYGVYIEGLLKKDGHVWVDALPRNIIVDAREEWYLIDQEWHANAALTPPVLMFRALFYFAVGSASIFEKMAQFGLSLEGAQSEFPVIESVDEFIAWGFSQLDLDYSKHRDECIQFENQLQQQILRTGFQSELTPLLEKDLYEWQALDVKPEPLEIRAFWTQVKGVWHMDHSVGEAYTEGFDAQMQLVLPQMLTTHRYLRLDPAADIMQLFNGGLSLKALNIVVMRDSGQQDKVYSLESTEQLLAAAELQGFRVTSSGLMVATSADAQILLDLQQIIWGDNIQQILLRFQWETVPDDTVNARQFLKEEAIRMTKRVALKQHILNRQQQRIDASSEVLQALEKKVAECQARLEQPKGLVDKVLGKLGFKNT